jgi:hypothetical protein
MHRNRNGMKEIIRRELVEGRRNHASQPYRFGSRSVPRGPFSFNFAELVSPHVHTLKQHEPHPYIESGNRFPLLVYRTPGFEARKLLFSESCCLEELLQSMAQLA